MKLGQDVKLENRPRCLDCGELLDGATAVESDGSPQTGDVTICIYCGHIMVYDKKLNFREPNTEEARQIAGDPRILAIQRARKAITLKKPNETKR